MWPPRLLTDRSAERNLLAACSRLWCRDTRQPMAPGLLEAARLGSPLMTSTLDPPAVRDRATDAGTEAHPHTRVALAKLSNPRLTEEERYEDRNSILADASSSHSPLEVGGYQWMIREARFVDERYLFGLLSCLQYEQSTRRDQKLFDTSFAIDSRHLQVAFQLNEPQLSVSVFADVFSGLLSLGRNLEAAWFLRAPNGDLSLGDWVATPQILTICALNFGHRTRTTGSTRRRALYRRIKFATG